MYKNLITKKMIDEFNFIMRKENSCLRIVFNYEEYGIMKYRLCIEDKYMDTEYMPPNLTKEAEGMVREFFKDFGIKLPFSNQVIDIWAYEIIE